MRLCACLQVMMLKLVRVRVLVSVRLCVLMRVPVCVHAYAVDDEACVFAC